MELIFFAILVYLAFFRNRGRKKIDREYQELVARSQDAKVIAVDIKNYLLRILRDDSNDVPKFSDSQLTEAARIYDRAGPASLYWMTEIAAQMTLLASAQINQIPTNVNAELGDCATPEQVVNIVVQTN
jgi:hypothetical protein